MSNNGSLKSPTKSGNTKKRNDVKMGQKACPSCNESIPVACKSCSCGHQFPSRRQRLKSEVEKLQSDRSAPDAAAGTSKDNSDTATDDKSDTSDTVKPRRTERRKAERPNFFSSLDLDSTKKSSKSTSNDSPTKKKRGRPRISIDRPPKEQKDSKSGSASSGHTPDDDIFSNVPPAKMIKYSIILSELNRKIQSQTFIPT